MSSLSQDQIALPGQLQIPENCLAIWVIYDHPLDCPDGYVLRAHIVHKGTAEPSISLVSWRSKDPAELRSILPGHLINTGRHEGDDPAILECWI